MNDATPSITVKSIKANNKDLEIQFNADDIVLLVGPNNVGKSRMLKDLQEDIINDGGSKVIIDAVQYNSRGFSAEQVRAYFERNVSKDSCGNYCVSVIANQTYCYNTHDFEGAIENEKYFYKVLFSFLSTENRLNMTRSIRFNEEVDRNALNIIERLEDRPEALMNLNEALDESFGKSVDIYMHYEEGNAVTEYRIGDSQEVADALNSIKPDWKNKIQQLDDLQSQGDGVRSAVAILASLIVGEHSLFLIDEPEAFLHPPQAKMIGRSIVNMSKGKQCFIATHNIDFIKGVIEADSSRVKIIKIGRSGNSNTFDLIDNNDIREIATDRNLKYTGILDGLFYDRVVLCENETDCKFYAAMLESVSLAKYQGSLFCAVGGKDQFKKVIPLIKRLCIQYLAIADIDLINSANNLKQLLDAIEPDGYNVVRNSHKSFLIAFQNDSYQLVKTQSDIRKEIDGVYDGSVYMSPEAVKKIRAILKNASSFDLLKSGGRKSLPQGDCIGLFDEINERLNELGFFIVECGEIERFVPDVKGHGNKWLEGVFAKHSDIENDEVYNDAKAFIEKAFGDE